MDIGKHIYVKRYSLLVYACVFLQTWIDFHDMVQFYFVKFGSTIIITSAARNNLNWLCKPIIIAFYNSGFTKIIVYLKIHSLFSSTDIKGHAKTFSLPIVFVRTK